MPSARILSLALESLLALTRSIIRRRSGSKARKGLANDLGPTSASRQQRQRRAMRSRKLYAKTPCITAVSAKGVFPRLKHAVVSTFTARRGVDGHRVFSFPDLVAPYAGTMTAVYAWYPGRYGYKDAFRMGNYSLLGYVGANISLEFLYSGPHSLLTRMHLNDTHGAPDPGSKP